MLRSNQRISNTSHAGKLHSIHFSSEFRFDTNSFRSQFAILLAIVFFVELAVGIVACLYKADLEDVLRESLDKSIKRSSGDDLAAWDNAQRQLTCCGVNGPADWIDLSPTRAMRTSCCRPSQIDEATQDCARSPALFKDRYYTDGCLGKMKQRVGSNTSVLIAVGLSVAFIQLLGIILACWLASSIRRETVN